MAAQRRRRILKDKNSQNKHPIKTVIGVLSENGIKQDKCSEYYEFLIHLMDELLINYLGDDVTNERILERHFHWVWNKASVGKYKNFQNLDSGNDMIVKSIFEMVYPSFYLSEKTTTESVEYLKKLFENIFTFTNDKTIIETNTLIDLYEKFTKI